ncbi:hypothetical protein CSV80_15245 [Sporosarcina sp. P12(2017)]|nr:hypothetical protein CSV81_16090 [Sporosarcina sp. P10]PIC59626.1 hypothetical protein CSV80_15245 [Sporosarcina sp. P12(2017)]
MNMQKDESGLWFGDWNSNRGRFPEGTARASSSQSALLWGLELALILQESPLLPLQSLLLKCIDIDHSLVVLPELLLPFNLSKFKYKSINLFINMRLESIFKHCLCSYFFFIYQTSEHNSS